MSDDSPKNAHAKELAIAQFVAAVEAFRDWAIETYPQAVLTDCDAAREALGGEWELNFEGWDSIHKAGDRLLTTVPHDEWTKLLEQEFFYILARDNETEWLKGSLARSLPLLERLAKSGVAFDQSDARWQLVSAVGGSELSRAIKLDLLKPYANDAHEYVRRRCLSELATITAPQTETLALVAWLHVGEERPWSRMAALDALARIGSPRLPPLLAEALQDPDEHLRGFAERLVDTHSKG